MKKISVLMPTYNDSKTIMEAMNSIVSQSYDYWELMVIDDGSSDETKDIVNNYITKEVYFYLRPLVFNENTIFIILISIIGVILISLIIPIVHLSKKRPINLINE